MYMLIIVTLDPLHILQYPENPAVTSSSSTPQTNSNAPLPSDNSSKHINEAAAKGAALARSGSIKTERRREKFEKVLRGRQVADRVGLGNVDPGELRRMAWSGIAEEARPIAWMMLLVR